MHAGQDYAELIGDMYCAAMEPARWSSVARRIAAAAGVERAVIGGVDEDFPGFSFLETHDLPADTVALLREYFFALPQRPPHSKLVRVSLAEPVHLGGGVGTLFRAGVLVRGDGGGWGAICLHQPAHLGQVSSAALDVAAEIAPHLGWALWVHRRRLLLEASISRPPGGRRLAIAPGGRRTLDSKLLCARHGLTEREFAVCEQFLNLASVEDTATALGVEVSTVRFHLKSIYAKTHARTLPALMRLLVESQ